jgi:hypothetical protein
VKRTGRPKYDRKGGRRRPADAKLILAQVKREFKAKWDELGAKEAAEELGVGLASFYNYANGKTLPDLDVLRKASKKWEIKWQYMDLAAIMKRQNVTTPKQLVFGFLNAVQAKDVEVVEVDRKGSNLLRVEFRIRFSA